MGLDAGEGEEASFSLFEELHQPFLLWWGSPEKEFLNKLLREEIEKAIDALPEAFRVAVVLSDLEGFSYREIAQILRLPVGTVRSRLARGRSLLQKALWAHAQEALKHLLAYLDQELGEERRREMARHLSICRGCFSRAEFEKRLKGKLREIGRASARSGFQKRIKAFLDQI